MHASGLFPNMALPSSNTAPLATSFLPPWSWPEANAAGWAPQPQPQPDVLSDILRQQKELLASITAMPMCQNVSTAAGEVSLSPMDRSEGELSEEDLEAGPYMDSDASSGEEDVNVNLKNFFNKEEAFGPDVREETAAIVNAGLRSVVSLEREKELTVKIVHPANCEGLVVPKIKRHIWDILPRGSREADLGVQGTQFFFFIRASPPLSGSWTAFSGKEDKSNVKLTAEAFKVLALASCQLSQKRKELVALNLKPPFRRICSASNPVTSYLFGDKLHNLFKDIKDTQSVGAKMSRTEDRSPVKGRSKLKPRHFACKFRQPF